ncbi:MAG: hypothetical protein M3P26_07645 [Gemmatimonadota bacterium]|nr:hypothetical protein [Gemmatimonadota bacterium]
MTNREDIPEFGDIEKPHETVADSFSDGLAGKPLTVRLGDLWSDFVRVADERRDPDAPPRSPSAVPLLDDMKGILQWD